MIFKKKTDIAFDFGERKEAMLLNMVQDCGLALTPEEKKNLEIGGWVDTGKFNGHGQPLVKNTKTGEVLSVCRMQSFSSVCDVFLKEEKLTSNPWGIASNIH